MRIIFEDAIECLAMQAQSACGGRFVAFAAADDLGNDRAFDGSQIAGAGNGDRFDGIVGRAVCGNNSANSAAGDFRSEVQTRRRGGPDCSARRRCPAKRSTRGHGERLWRTPGDRGFRPIGRSRRLSRETDRPRKDILPAIAQRGNMHRDQMQVVVEFVKEFSAGDKRRQIVGGRSRDASPPTESADCLPGGKRIPFCITWKSLACTHFGSSETLCRNKKPAPACSSAPGRAVGMEPLASSPKRMASGAFVLDGAAVDFDEGLRRTSALIGNGADDQFLAHACAPSSTPALRPARRVWRAPGPRASRHSWQRCPGRGGRPSSRSRRSTARARAVERNVRRLAPVPAIPVRHETAWSDSRPPPVAAHQPRIPPSHSW